APSAMTWQGLPEQPLGQPCCTTRTSHSHSHSPSLPSAPSPSSSPSLPPSPSSLDRAASSPTATKVVTSAGWMSSSDSCPPLAAVRGGDTEGRGVENGVLKVRAVVVSTLG
ncbi:unnamed protein product, partial [Closterium sp. NIES-54]